MYIVFLKFAENKNLASDFMDGHKAWIKEGIEQNSFLVVGSLNKNEGGVVLANNQSYDEIKNRVEEDPFVIEKIVNYEIFELTPAMANEQFQFLLNK